MGALLDWKTASRRHTGRPPFWLREWSEAPGDCGAGLDFAGGRRQHPVRALDPFAEAVFKAARRSSEGFRCAFKWVFSGEELTYLEWNAYRDLGGPVTAHEFFVIPVFHTSGDTLEKTRFDAAFEPVEVRAKVVFVSVVSGVDAGLGELLAAGNKEADLGVESFKARLDLIEAVYGCGAQDSACGATAAGATLCAASDGKLVVFGDIVIEPGIDPVRE